LPLAVNAHDDFPHWHSLFDGRSTKGWTWAKPDHAGEWQVQDGALTQKDKVDVCTTDEFGDYELEIEFRSKPDGDGNSGVYLRGQVEVQIFNSTDKVKDPKDLKPHHGGGIYGKKPPMANPHRAQGEWNKYRILHLGNTINVWLNDVLIQSDVVVDAATPGSISAHPVTRKPLSIGKGPLMLQGDHDSMWFRNIRIRELEKGWTPLWNGKDLSEMKGPGDADPSKWWRLDGLGFTNRTLEGKAGGRDLWTRKSYGNFLVHYEYRSDPKVGDGNSGFYLRDQWELQINKTQRTDESHSDGSFYDIYPAKAKAMHAPGEWNEMDVKLSGNKAWVWQNGKLIHDGVELVRRTDDAGRKTAKFSRAPFKLQGDHDVVWFRNLYIKELPDGE
jgi:hypothetical protein